MRLDDLHELLLADRSSLRNGDRLIHIVSIGPPSLDFFDDALVQNFDFAWLHGWRPLITDSELLPVDGKLAVQGLDFR